MTRTTVVWAFFPTELPVCSFSKLRQKFVATPTITFGDDKKNADYSCAARCASGRTPGIIMGRGTPCDCICRCSACKSIPRGAAARRDEHSAAAWSGNLRNPFRPQSSHTKLSATFGATKNHLTSCNEKRTTFRIWYARTDAPTIHCTARFIDVNTAESGPREKTCSVFAVFFGHRRP